MIGIEIMPQIDMTMRAMAEVEEIIGIVTVTVVTVGRDANTRMIESTEMITVGRTIAQGTRKEPTGIMTIGAIEEKGSLMTQNRKNGPLLLKIIKRMVGSQLTVIRQDQIGAKSVKSE